MPALFPEEEKNTSGEVYETGEPRLSSNRFSLPDISRRYVPLTLTRGASFVTSSPNLRVACVRNPGDHATQGWNAKNQRPRNMKCVPAFSRNYGVLYAVELGFRK